MREKFVFNRENIFDRMLVMGFVIATAVLVMSGITPVWSGIGGWDFFGVPPKPWLYTGYLSALVATMLWIR